MTDHRPQIAVRTWGMALMAGLCFAGAIEAAPTNSVPAEPSGERSRPSLIDPQDGWLDASEFLDQVYGFLPLVVPITEPAVGYGAAGGLLFIDRPEQTGEAGFHRPNMTTVAGLGTDNGSWGVLAGDIRYWLDDRLQTVSGFVYAPLNLKFYGIGDSPLNEHPLAYTLTPLGGLLRAKYRLGEQSQWWAGLGYAFAATEVRFDQPASVPPGTIPTGNTFRTGGLTPSLSFDSRDNFFTPNRGIFAEVECGVYSAALGGDTEFQKPAVVAMGYLPLHPKLTLGLRVDGTASFGEVPFYQRPYISLRGVAAMRYQGDEVAQTEAELRWQFWKRFSLVGFGGVGTAWNNSSRFQGQETVTTGGAGFRYELARKHGLHAGMDIAFGPNQTAIYVQVGSAWMRP